MSVMSNGSRPGTASRRRRYHFQLTLLRGGSSVFERSESILAFRIWILVQQVVDARASGQLAEHRADG